MKTRTELIKEIETFKAENKQLKLKIAKLEKTKGLTINQILEEVDI